MITSTSLNASFIAKLVHAANVAIAINSYCEVTTSKGKPSILVEWQHETNSLRFTHISGQDVTSLCLEAIGHLVAMPSVELTPVVSMIETDQEEASSYGFIQAYLLFVMLGVLVALDWLSLGSALMSGAFALVAYRLAPLWLEGSHKGSEKTTQEIEAYYHIA